jgi:nucleotide-binding universal stress UspA family protein
MYKRIVVPLDGSELAEQALGQAIQLSKSTGSPLYLVRVVDISSMARYAGATPMAGADFGLLGTMVDEEREDSTKYITEMVKKLEGEGLQVSGEVLQGAVAMAIVDSASPEDVIVMSSHGRTGVSRWFLGSVAEEVVRKATCPVLLVRKGIVDATANSEQAVTQ